MSTQDLGFIHSFRPARKQGQPTLLLLHGTGGDESSLLPIGSALAPDAAYLSPRGRVMENGMPRYFRRLAEGVFDLEDLRARTHELADFVEGASGFYGLDRSGIVAVGYSNGANIAASLLLLRPGVLSAAVLFHAMVPLVPDELPDLSDVSVFLTAGRRDPIVPLEQVEQLAALLTDSGAVVELYWQSDGHSLTPDERDAAREWLNEERRVKREG